MKESNLYRKISIRMHGDAKFRRLSRPQPNGQSLWIYLLTGPHTTAFPGLSSAGEMTLAEGLGWELEALRASFGELFKEGLVKADWEARVIWLPKALEHNRPSNPNVVIGLRSQWNLIPECPLKFEALQQLRDFVKTLPEDTEKAQKSKKGFVASHQIRNTWEVRVEGHQGDG